MGTPYNACVDLLDSQAGSAADKPAVVTRERSVTYAELLDLVRRTAGGLIELGVQPEQRVAMVMLDSLDFYLVFLAAMRIGAVPVPLNPLLPGRDLAGIVASSRARVAVVSDARSKEIDVLRSGAPELHTVLLASQLPAGDPDVAAYTTWDESPGFWLCTSGSTGTPKLAMHRHIDLRATFDTYGVHALGIRPDDRCYSVGAMFHAYGLGNSLTFPFAVGASAIVEPTRPPTPALVGEIVRRFSPTLFFCIPTFYLALLASDLPSDTFTSVRYAVSAAEPLPADTFTRFRDRFGVEILDGIGSTEMTHIFVSNRPGAIRPGTSGQPVPGYDIGLVDERDAEVEPDTPGHLMVGGPSMATGYWCASASTRSAFRGSRMRTGDMYVRSADGYYTYLGRSDDMFRVGGEWVSPAEVEAVLIRHGSVREVAVVAEEDDRGVTRAVAFVVSAVDAFDPAELDVLCKSELAGYKRPRRYEVMDELPKTATGKIQRFKLRSAR